MAAMNSLYFTKANLEKLLKLAEENGKGVEITVSVNNEMNEYGKNVGAYVAQTKEEREAKAAKNYVGSGKTFWSDGQSLVAKDGLMISAGGATYAKEVSNTPKTSKTDDDIPF